MEAKVSVGTKEVLKNINKAYLRVGLYVTRGDGVGQKSEAAKRQSVVSGFLRHKWKKSITAGNTRGAMVSKNTHCIALQNMLTVTVIVTLQRVTLGNTCRTIVSKKTPHVRNIPNNIK